MRTNRFEIFSTSIAQLIKSVQYLKGQKMAQYGLKGTNALCLCQILESDGGLSATELARQGEIDKAQVSRCMAELMERGFVYRDDQNGRRYKQKYRLTPTGLTVAEDVNACIQEIQNAVSKNIPASDLDIFYKTLYKLCDNFAELIENRE
ncbi:MAG: MarR family transcriptional regulator [Ruminococcaceae bacterium]|nr:MarR family transcriptional regulator [Oscillospiraceae bacterium]